MVRFRIRTMNTRAKETSPGKKYKYYNMHLNEKLNKFQLIEQLNKQYDSAVAFSSN